jgi:TPR repeat protein
MKRWASIAIAAGLALALIGLLVTALRAPAHYPRDLSYWLRAAAARDWSAEAAEGQASAQLCCGLNLIRSNLVVMTDETVGLSGLPLIGKRYFESTSYSIGNTISQGQLTEAYGWIRKAADQGFAPAREAEKLFIGRIGVSNPQGGANGRQPSSSDTNRTPAAAASRRSR